MSARAKKQADVIRAVAVYDGDGSERLTLWGVDFTKGKDGRYFADLDASTFAAMNEAGRVKRG